MRLLVVEDEQKVAHALRDGLEGEGYHVALEHTGEGAFFRATTETFDVILLDVMLPGRDGLEILMRLRERGVKTPVLVLTARDTLDDRVKGLDAGADDYLVKPFAFAELVARVRALLRRSQGPSTVLRVGDLEIDLLQHSARRGGVAIALTAKEFAVLCYLARHPDRPVSRAELLAQVWSEGGVTAS